MAVKLKSKAEIKSEKLKSVISEGRDRRKGTNGIDKKSVTVHKGGADVTGSTTLSTGTPNDEQLARINKFTRSPKTADEVYVINTLSANDLPDRDDDYFDTDTLKAFAELPQPFSPIGKSFMFGHDYSTLPQGRIFGAGTAKAEGANFLTNEVYVPKTPQYENYIESVDFGINWAVSVGVLLEAQLCSICKAPQYSGWFYGGVCETGHFKGAMYDPKEERTDDWGYIIEAAPGDKNAVKALGNMHGAKDFYELSQVFLGAQFFASLDTGKGFSKALKSKSFQGAKIPIIGLSSTDAEELPLQHVDPKVADAIVRFKVEHDKDGSMAWTDDEGLIWNYAPGDAVTCLGKTADADDEQEEQDDEGTSGESSDADGEAGGTGEVGVDPGVEESVDGGSGDDPDGEDDPGLDDGDADEVGSDGDLTSDDEDDDTDTEKGVDSAMTKAKVLAAARRAKCPAQLLSAIESADGDGLEAVLRAASSHIRELSASVAGLTPKAALGDKFLSSKRASAIDAYVKSQVGTTKGVDTSLVEKMLDSFGDNVDLIDGLTEQYSIAAKAKLPGIRRSSEPTDPNERQEVQHNPATQDQQLSSRGRKTVTRIHG